MAEPSLGPRPMRRWAAMHPLTLEVRDARTRARREETERRLRAARQHGATLLIRIPPYIRLRLGNGKGTPRYYALCGQALLMRLPEVIDVWDLLRDLKRFLKSWRPMRLRTPAERLLATETLEQWDRLADALGRDGRWQVPQAPRY